MNDRRIATVFFTLAALGAAVQGVQWKQDVSGAAVETEATEHDTKSDLSRRRRRKSGVNFEFGGEAHGTNPGDSYGQYLTRPEVVHSLKCKGNNEKCEKCDDKSTCFHGVSEKNPQWGSQDWGFQKISVNPGDGRKNYHYVSEIWVRCDTAFGKWYIWSSAGRIQNGRVDIYVGGVKKTPNGGWKPGPNGAFLTLNLKQGSERVQVKFYPDPGNAISKCSVWVEAYEADEAVDTCMETKQCLKMFGDNTDPIAFRLRNNNEMQEKCLQNQISGFGDGMRRKCRQWQKCLENQQQSEELLNLMQAALEPYNGLTAPSPGTISSNNCVDPSIEDPESWDCDCVGVWTRECKKGQYKQMSTTECLNDIMCKSPNICCGWKQYHCKPWLRCGSLVEKVAVEVGEAAMVKRSGSSMREEAEVNASQTSSLLALDSLLQGKCHG